MAPLSKLTLTSYRRTQPHRDPIEERRSKTLAALTQQKLVLAVLVLPMRFAKPHQFLKYAVYGIMFGIFIELAQPFVNRSSEVGDVLADTFEIALGCAVGVGLRAWISRFYCLSVGSKSPLRLVQSFILRLFAVRCSLFAVRCSLFAVRTVFGSAERRSFGAIHIPVL